MERNEDLRVPGGWEARYQSGEIPWDLGEAPPVLVALLAEPQEGAVRSADLRVLVPGAGYGHDALAFARAGYRVTAVDVAPTAVAGIIRRARDAQLEVEALVADLFDLPEDLRGRFDLVWEQTCFCAVDPGRRAAYVAAMADALMPAGRLIGLFWNHGEAQGPPWSLDEATVRGAFASHFEITRVTPVAVSAGTRSNEFLVRMRKR